MQLQKKNRKKIIQIPIFILLGLIVVGLAVVFGLFHIRQVDVVGNEFYSAQEIQKMVMSDSMSENALYLSWKYSKAEASEKLPFLSAVEVSLITPYHVQIKVYEKAIVGYLMYSGSMVYFDRDGNVVEISQEAREGVPPFSGISITQPVVSEKLPVAQEGFLDDLITGAWMLNQSGIKVKEVHYDDKQQMILYFGNNRAILGDTSYLEEKLTNLQALLPQMEELSGTLHMENYTVGTTTITFKKGEEGEEELLMDVTGPEGESSSEDPEGGEGSDEDGDGTGTGDGENDGENKASGYEEDESRITTDADGNQMYTDEGGNVTYDLEKNYLGEDGQVISDGYGYIDPYTGAYFLN